jgi:putative redox protein
VLRFDFTGLGSSEGEFANAHFSSNVDDLVAAADHMRKTHGPPAILIEHSLGGAAVLAASHKFLTAPWSPLRRPRPSRHRPVQGACR